MILRPGDRVRVETTGDDGFPVVKYGFVGGVTGGDDLHPGPVVVMLDGELGGDVIDPCCVQPVSITNVELRLAGHDLMDEPELRRGLIGLWHAEADTAGLDVDALHPLGDGLRDSSDSWALAELTAGGEQYVVRAFCLPNEPGVVRVRADRPNRWDG
ncbi:MAG: hypothetical protein F2534_14140 [Actinobacteria bacterium]|uniref:Unannotated protein n=1 Tax=freshwater metagenome TaxID=449393 RepID=A0A6J6EMG3_9ZZZZ|nr:hypothetical protein [Actinomycetota bacterium]